MPSPQQAPGANHNVWTAGRSRGGGSGLGSGNGAANVHGNWAKTGVGGRNGSGSPHANGGGGSNGVIGGAEEKSVGGANAFNDEEVREYMRKAYRDAIAGDTNRTAFYTPPKDTISPTITTPRTWAPKPGNMANGQDFFVHVAKQIAALEQRARGG